jgi:translocation and assembly module TamB
VKKRKVALVFLAALALLAGGALVLVRTPWAGQRICRAAAARLEAAAGLPVAFGACRVDPFALSVEIERLAVGDPAAPLFSADLVAARLAPLQALARPVHLEEVRLVRPRVRVDVPEGGGGDRPCRLDPSAHVQIRSLSVEEGAAEVRLPGGVAVRAARVDVVSRPAPLPPLQALAGGLRRARVEVTAAGVELTAGGRTFRAPAASLQADVPATLASIDVREAAAEVEGVRLGLRGRVEAPCEPRLDLVATAEAPLPALVALAGRAAPSRGRAALELRLQGAAAPAPAVSGRLWLEGAQVGAFTPGDATGAFRLEDRRIVVDALELPARGGHAIVRGSIVFAEGLPVEAEATLDGVDLGEILHRSGVREPWVSLKLDGTVKAAGTAAPFGLEGEAALDVRDFHVYRRSFRDAAPGEPAFLDVPRARVETAISADRDGLAFERARVSGGRGALEAEARVAFRHEGGVRVRAEGQLDLDPLGHVSGLAVGGLATLAADVSAVPYGNPTIRGIARVAGLRFLDVDLGTAAADVAYGDDRVLRFEDVTGARGETRWRGEARVDLARTPVWVEAPRFEAAGRLSDLYGAVLDWLPATRLVLDVNDGAVEVSGSASGPGAALDARFDARLGPGTLFGRAYESGRAIGEIRRGALAVFERVELRRGAGAARGSGTWAFAPPLPWDLAMEFQGVALADLALPGGPWAGTASGTARLQGSPEAPRVSFSGAGAGVAVRGAELGAVQAGGTIEGERLALTGSAGGLRFSGGARLAGRGPFTARAEVELADAARLVPGGAPTGLALALAGAAEAEGELADPLAARATARLGRLALSYQDFQVEADGEVRLEARAGRVEVAPFTLRGANTAFTVSGARAPGGAVDADVSGTLDLRLAGGLFPGIRKLAGQLALEAHVSGTLEDPVLVGAGRVEDGSFRLDGVPVAFGGLRGPLAFSQNRVLFDRVDGAVNGGRARFAGEVGLLRLRPDRFRIEGVLDEVPMAVPVWIPVVLSGRAEWAGTPAESALTGRLRVVRSRYTENVGLDKSVFEARRRAVVPARPYDQALEWLRFDVQLVVDGDVRVENDLARGPVRGEVTLTGTLAQPGMVGTLAMGEGSQATFRGNEFVLQQAMMTFSDRHRLAMAIDVHGQSQVRDYQIFMHAFGPLEDPQLDLTSSPPLSQQDLITLLSLGFTTRDAAAGAGVGGVARAAAAQALFTASGLDEQVRRFLPRGGGLLRDLDVRITSVYSEGTGQVEPRAEFESWVLRDRLRLRYQAPLGSSRGQRAQAELRLGRRTALQYQWDNDNPDVATGDHGLDLKLRLEWND